MNLADGRKVIVMAYGKMTENSFGHPSLSTLFDVEWVNGGDSVSIDDITPADWQRIEELSESYLWDAWDAPAEAHSEDALS